MLRIKVFVESKDLFFASVSVKNDRKDGANPKVQKPKSKIKKSICLLMGSRNSHHSVDSTIKDHGKVETQTGLMVHNPRCNYPALIFKKLVISFLTLLDFTRGIVYSQGTL